MSETAFQVMVRKALDSEYHPYGVVWLNDTGYGASHHAPFPNAGGGDLIGCIMGLWIEVENKAKVGRWRAHQQLRRMLVNQCGGAYLVCKEVGLTFDGDFDAGITRLCERIDAHALEWLHPKKYAEFSILRQAKRK